MITCHAFIASSLDGFIARSGGEIDWLEGWPEVDHDYGFREFMDSVDGLIMGRGTYEKALTFKQWPYDKSVVVLSRSLPDGEMRDDLNGKVRISRSEPKQLLHELDREGWKRAYVDGGQVIQSFLREGLIEDMVLTRIPILIGAGLPLFGALPADVKLTHLKTEPYASGFVQSRYAVAGERGSPGVPLLRDWEGGRSISLALTAQRVQQGRQCAARGDPFGARVAGAVTPANTQEMPMACAFLQRLGVGKRGAETCLFA